MRLRARALAPWLPATLALALALLLPFGASTRAQKPAAEAPKADRDDDEVGAPTVLDRVRDEIELLQVQLDIKKAHTNVTEVRLQQARKMLQVQERLVQTGTAGADKLRQAQADVAVLEAQYAAEQAELKEPEVRLKHARQHLAALQQHPELTRPMGMMGMMRPGMMAGAGGGPMMGGAGMMGGPGGGEMIRVLDKKVDRLIDAVEELRNEVGSLKKEK
ncbi:MAG TPA: hypothetical protein VG406_05400 [Isosphaeraceae bacterium]|jgi:hypothetical protein|nr:hypothetical protein [Isosphaeraceae bacterium]